MDSTNIDSIFDQLSKKGGFECGEGADRKTIREYESSLQVEFPIYYRIFLQRFGYAEWEGGNYIAGIHDGYFSVVSETEYHRKRFGEHPSPWVIGIFTDTVLFCDPSERAGQIQTLGGNIKAERFSWNCLGRYLICRGAL